MGSPKLKDIKRLFVLSGNQCAMPGCHNPIYDEAGIAIGHLCHIKAANKGGPRYDEHQSEAERHAFENLILLCSNHHSLIDGDIKIYSVDALQEIKANHENYRIPNNVTNIDKAAQALRETIRGINNSGNIAINSPGAIQGQTIIVRTGRMHNSIPPPSGSIGADVNQTGYIQYLINRYNEFAAKHPSRERKFNYGAISKNLRDKFGTNWKLVPDKKFAEMVSVLHCRIDRTQIARINKGKHQKAYLTFEEYMQKHNNG